MASILSLDIFSSRNSDYVFDASPMFGFTSGNRSVVDYIAGADRVRDAMSDDDSLADLMNSVAQTVCPDVHVIVTTNDTSCTDGSTIIISKKPLETSKDIDIITGLMLHEVSHCLYTDFDYVANRYKNLSHRERQLVHWIHNVIEDEMIERKLGSEYPGYMRVISKVKTEYFGTNKDIFKVASTKIDYVLTALLYWVRYPEMLKPHYGMLSKYDSLFYSILNVLKDEECDNYSSESPVTQRSWNAATRIFNIIKSMIYENDEEAVRDISNSTTHGTDSSMSSISTSECGDNLKYNIENVISEEVVDESKKSHTKAGSPFRSTPKNADNEVSPEIRDVKNTSITRYNTVVSRSKELIDIARKMIVKNETKKFLETRDNMRNGTIDVRKIASAMCGDDCVWRQSHTIRRKNKSSRYALVITIDASGSMQYSASSKKTLPHMFAKQMAVAIAEAMRGYEDIDFYAYAHGDYVERLVSKNASDRSSIINYSNQYDQNELKSYKMIADDVIQQSKDTKVIMINLTDSLYIVPSIDNMKQMMSSYSNVSWNCIAIDPNIHEGSIETDYAIKYNNKLYGENRWSHCPCTYKGMIDSFKAMIKIINMNYHKR